MEENINQKMSTMPVQGYRRRVLNAMCGDMTDVLYTEVKKPERRYGLQKEDCDVLTARLLNAAGFNRNFRNKIMMQSEEILYRADMAHLDLLIFGHDEDMIEFPTGRGSSHINSLTSKMEDSFRPLDRSELENAIVVRSAVVYFPINLKLTDEHLAHMDSPMPSKCGTVWPYRWELEGEPGTYTCVVKRVDDNIYEFKVNMLADKPADLAGWLKMYTALKQIGGITVCAHSNVINQADLLIATAAKNFFKEQLAIKPYVMVYFRTALNDSSPPKWNKKSMVTKLKNTEFNFPSTSIFDRLPKEVKPRYYRNCFQSIVDANHKPKNMFFTTKHAHFLSGVFGYNPGLPSDVARRFETQRAGISSVLFDILPELHLSKEELRDLIYSLCHVRNCGPESIYVEDRVNG